MSELIDVLSASGLRTGEVLPRTEIAKQASLSPELNSADTRSVSFRPEIAITMG